MAPNSGYLAPESCLLLFHGQQGTPGPWFFSFREFGLRPNHRRQMAFGPQSHLGTKNVHLQKEAAGPDPAPGAQQVGCQQGALCSEPGLNLYKKLHPTPPYHPAPRLFTPCHFPRCCRVSFLQRFCELWPPQRAVPAAIRLPCPAVTFTHPKKKNKTNPRLAFAALHQLWSSMRTRTMKVAFFFLWVFFAKNA